MTAYYNEFDPFAAAWLRNLIDAGLIAPGVVDDRSITDVTASDLTGFTQCHFFAGIGGWSYALRLAGVPDDFPCWTGSPPCQPFSVAGRQLGQLDERHLAPTFMRLVAQCRPPVLFGEQVAAAISKHWLDDLFTELETEGYACGAAVLPACSVGAPHKRDRLFFGAQLLEYASAFGRNARRQRDNSGHDRQQPAAARKSGCMADDGLQQRSHTDTGCCAGGVVSQGWQQEAAPTAGCGRRGGVAHIDSEQLHGRGHIGAGRRIEFANSGSPRRMADSNDDRQQSGCGRSSGGESSRARDNAGRCESTGGLAHTYNQRPQRQWTNNDAQRRTGSNVRSAGLCDGAGSISTNPHNSFWSDADWLGCRDGKFRPVEPGSFPLVDGFSNIMDDLRTIEASVIAEVENHASTCKTDTRQILSALREALQQEACRQTQRFGMLFKLYAPEILLSFLFSISAAYESRTISSRIQKTNDEHCWKFLRMLRLWGKFSDSPRRWRSYELCTRELADPLFAVSLILARHVETYWSKTLEAHAASNRVGILRGFGNAIVPQVAAEFITAFLAAAHE